MKINSNAGTSLIFYTGTHYAGTAHPVTHGQTGQLAASSASWTYQSVAMSGMQAFINSAVNPGDPSMVYLGHQEGLVTVSQDDLKRLYPSSDQFPLNYLGVDPALAVVVWLDVDAGQAAPNAVASLSQVGGSLSSLTTLSLPGRRGVLGFAGKDGALVAASCSYGDYNASSGTVAWSGQSGVVVMQYTGGQLTLDSTSGFPEGWTFSDPQLQGDGSWVVTLNGGVPASDTIGSVTANPVSIVNDGVSASVITASVVDGNHQPADGVTVHWSTQQGSVDPLSSVTGEDGMATTTLTDNGAPGTATVTASLDSGSQGSTAVTVTDSAAGYTIVALTSNKDAIENDGVDVAQLTAMVQDAQGNPAEGVAVYWSTTLGTLNHAEQNTNGSGQSQVSLTDTGDAGKTEVTASLDNGNSKIYSIALTDSIPAFIIKGNRSSNKASGQLSISRLVALDPSTFLPIVVDWSYDQGVVNGTGSDFLDVSPEKPLTVSVEGEKSYILNPSNIIGNGEWTDTSTSDGAFVARLNDGTCEGWGVSGYGGVTPSSQLNNNIKTFSSTFYSFTAIREDNSIFSWGDTTEGGVTPENIKSLKNIKAVRGSRGTFGIIATSSPYIQTWGWGTEGGEKYNMSVPSDIASKNNIQSLIANDNAFVAINASGQVYAWGESTSGGETSSTVDTLYDVTECCASRRAFAVIANGKVYAWGDGDYGAKDGSVSDVTDAVRMISTESAYTVMRANGGIACWGNVTYGNNLPSEYQSRNDIIDVKATYGAFAALCKDGTVISWGNDNFGANSSSVSALLHNIVSISASSSSFAALTREGNVVTWGDASTGGNSSSVAAELYDICAIYSNSHAFVALRADDNVIMWGAGNSGAQNVPYNLNGNVSYLKK